MSKEDDSDAEPVGMSRKVEEEIVGVDILPEAIKFADSPYFAKKIKDFTDANMHYFIPYLRDRHREDEDSDRKYDEGSVGGGRGAPGQRNSSFNGAVKEYDLRITEIFNDYQRLLDGLFDEFANKHSVSSRILYDCCRDCAEGRFVPLFEEDENKWFVDTLLSWMQFQTFVDMMIREGEKERGGSGSKNARK